MRLSFPCLCFVAFCGPHLRFLRPLFLAPLLSASFYGLCLRLLLGPLFSIFWQFLRRCVLFSRPFFGLCFRFFGFSWPFVCGLILRPLFAASFGAIVFDFLLFPAFVCGFLWGLGLRFFVGFLHRLFFAFFLSFSAFSSFFRPWVYR